MKARVLYDFESGGEGELNLTANEVLTVTNQDIGEGWWEAKNSQGQVGLVPSAYVEITSFAEPKIPPPPPPATYMSQTSVERKSQFGNAQPSAPPPVAVLPQPAVQQKPQVPPATWQQPQDSALRSQESYDDWDDDWDDDDSSTTTETPGMDPYQGGGNSSVSIRTKDDGKFGTVSKGISKRFTKQAGDAFLFGTAVATNVSQADKLAIFDTSDGPFWKQADGPYTCTIASPKKESKFHGMKSFIAYQVTPSFSGIQVSRRYKHFDWLHERLVDKFPCIVIPPLPDKQIAGRYEEDFIQGRMQQLQLWVDRMCKHPVIARSEVFHHFLTCPPEEKRWKTGKRRAESDEYRGGKFFCLVETPAAPLEQRQVESELERFARFVKSLDDSVRHMYNIGENSTKRHQGPFRKEYQKIGHSLVALARSFEFDERPSAQALTQAIHHTGNTYDSIGKCFEDQPRHDMIPLLEALQEYKGILDVFPDILSVHKAASNKAEESFTKLSDSEAQAVQGRVDVISYACQAEINHFNQHRVGDYKSMMQKYLQGQISFFQNIVSQLQATLAQYDQA